MRIKRLFDITASSAGLIITAPILATTALAVRWKLGSPVLFRQERAGKDGKPFIIYKFRTMTSDRGPDGKLLPDEQRLGQFGRFLRASSLDELPELFNVLKGDMSLVGPRPLFMHYLPLYNEEQARRHKVRPGITGWAQVNGRNTLTWSEKFAHDVWYVDNQSFSLDLKILTMTIWQVFRRVGINQEGRATVDYFTGNKAES